MSFYGLPVEVKRDIEVTEIPSGYRGTLPSGKTVRITQKLGGAYTVITDEGHLLRVDGRDADAIEQTSDAESVAPSAATFSEEKVWEQLRTVYDPEIPVNVVDLGLIYECKVEDAAEGQHIVNVKMTMTAPGCGMADVLKMDVENKVKYLPGVKDVKVEVVFDPPWNPGLMSDAAKLKLGLL
jgi:probable FeS assembly SUF system protein SufT